MKKQNVEEINLKSQNNTLSQWLWTSKNSEFQT